MNPCPDAATGCHDLACVVLTSKKGCTAGDGLAVLAAIQAKAM